MNKIEYFDDKIEQLKVWIEKAKVQKKAYQFLIKKQVREDKAFQISVTEDYERILVSSEFSEADKSEFRKIVNL